MTPPLRIAIDAQFEVGGASGGIEQFVMALLRGLAGLDDGPERYVLVCPEEARSTWEPYIRSNLEIHVAEPPRQVAWIRSAYVRRAAAHIRRYLRHSVDLPPRPIPRSDGFFETLGVQVVHFPHQLFQITGVPSIYNPHDLQHRELPQFFSRSEIAWRNALYEAGCRQAAAIVVSSAQTKGSLRRWLDIDDAKIQLIRHASLYQDGFETTSIERLRRDFRLPDSFAYFPAQTWPHKNHIRLLEALHQLRAESSIALNVVFTGAMNEHWPVIAERIASLNLQGQVNFLGYVGDGDVAALYREADFLILPSLFEGTGMPILEALTNGTAIACSDIDVLREYAGDAAVYFDPHSTGALVEAIKSLISDEDLRLQLGRRSRERARLFTLNRMAQTYRALYRRVAGMPLQAADQLLLAGSGEAE